MCQIYNTPLFLAQVLNPLRGNRIQIKVSLLWLIQMFGHCGLGLRILGLANTLLSLKLEKAIKAGKFKCTDHKSLVWGRKSKRDNRIRSNRLALPQPRNSGTSLLLHGTKCQETYYREVPLQDLTSWEVFFC